MLMSHALTIANGATDQSGWQDSESRTLSPKQEGAARNEPRGALGRRLGAAQGVGSIIRKAWSTATSVWLETWPEGQ